MTRVLVLGGSSYVAQFILQRYVAAAHDSGDDGDSAQRSSAVACTMRGLQASTSPLPAGFVSASTATASSSTAASSSQVLVYWGVDLGAMTGVRECIRHFRPDVIVNCVAMSSPAACEKEPARTKAINEPRELVEFIGSEIEWTVRFVHFSTDFVYDGANPPPHGYKETDAVEAESSSLTVYGASKLAFDAFLLAQQQYANLSGFVLRIANVIGPQAPLFADQPPKFMEWLHQQLFVGNTSSTSSTPQLRLWSDEIRSFIYVRDLADIVLALLEREDDDSSAAGSSPRFLLLNIGLWCSWALRLWSMRLVRKFLTALSFVVNAVGGIDALSRVELAERYCEAYQRISMSQATASRATVAPTSRASVDLGYHPPLNAHLDTSLLRHQLPSLSLTPTDRIMDEISRELLAKS